MSRVRRTIRLANRNIASMLGMERRGFFIPYPYKKQILPPNRRPPYKSIESLFANRSLAFRSWLGIADQYFGELSKIGCDPSPGPRWHQDWFPRLDAAMAYTMVRHYRPKHIVEVGSGHSTRFVARAVVDGGLESQIVAIDPRPRANLFGLANVRIDQRCIQEIDYLTKGYMKSVSCLLVDSSHVLMPGSDVDLILNHLLPDLVSGTIVQIHDVFLPDDYPTSWERRSYNEQLGVAGLLSGGSWQVEFSSHFVATRLLEILTSSRLSRLPIKEGAFESSLWLRKV